MKKFQLALTLLFAVGLMFTTGCKDACEKDDPCINGTCSDVDGDATCTCDAGYEGTTCADEQRDKFEGNWSYTDSCLPGNNTSSVISESGSDVSAVLISNILGADLGGDALATVSGNSISIASQSVVDTDGDTWTVSSTTGTLSGSTFNFTVTITFGTATQTCEYTFNKQ